MYGSQPWRNMARASSRSDSMCAAVMAVARGSGAAASRHKNRKRVGRRARAPVRLASLASLWTRVMAVAGA